MSEKHTCCARIYSGYVSSHTCGKGAAYEHEGKWYCKTHHPPTVKAKTEARNAKWEAEWNERHEREKAAADAAAEQKRKAEAYDQLAERNAELVEALRTLHERFLKSVAAGASAEEAYDSFYQFGVADVLAKCQPKPQEGQT